MKSKRFFRFIKRTIDIILSFLAIIVFSWLLILVGLLVLIFSGWPIFYRDKRVGMNGKTIKVLKFRTMKKNANDNLENILSKDQIESWKKERKIEKDPRITKIGRILRKTSLDEIPQVFNIFCGSISIIGPRPISQTELETHYTEDERKILLSARPGLVSNWSVNGRSQVSFESGLRQKLELEYFDKFGFAQDVKIFFKVIPVVISCKGAK